MSKRLVGQCEGCGNQRSLTDGRCDRCASAKQVAYLRGLGVAIPAGLTKEDATRLINAALSKVPPTAKQLEYLAGLCVPIAALQPISKADVDGLIQAAYAARDYAWQLFDEHFRPERGPDGKFAKGSLKGVTAEFAECQTDRMRRFILADAELRTRVQALVESGEARRGIPHDDIRAAILSGIAFDRPNAGPAAATTQKAGGPVMGRQAVEADEGLWAKLVRFARWMIAR